MRKWLTQESAQGNLTSIPPQVSGVVDTLGQPVTADRLMADRFIPIASSACGVLVPEEAILKRKQYGWFPMIEAADAVQVESNLGERLLLSLSKA